MLNPVNVLKVLFVCTLLAAGFYFSQAISVYGKAWLAQSLLACAWTQSVDNGRPTKPWPWSDSAVIGTLTIPTLGIEQPLLDGEQGSALAFAPGLRWLDTAGGKPLALIQGHRDTHLSFIKTLEAEQLVSLTTLQGVQHFRVESTHILESPMLTLNPLARGPFLFLSTCYPFANQTGASASTKRYVVVLRKV